MIPELAYSPPSDSYSSPDSDAIRTPFCETGTHEPVQHALTNRDHTRPESGSLDRSYSQPHSINMDHVAQHSSITRLSPPAFTFDFGATAKSDQLDVSPFCSSSPELDEISPRSSSPLPTPSELYPTSQNAQPNHLSSQLAPSFGHSMTYSLNGVLYSPRFSDGHKLNRRFVHTYKLEDELGAGGYGFVMTARHRVEECEVAVKFIIKDKVPEHSWMEDETFGKMPSEVMLLSLIDHPNVAKCLDLFEDGDYFYLVQELHGSPWPKTMRKRPVRPSAASCDVPSESTMPSLSPSASVDSFSASSEPATPPTSSIDIAMTPADMLADDQHYRDSNDMKQDAHKPLAVPRPQYSRRPSHDLFECIEQSKHKRLPEAHARYVFSQIVDVVHYLDANGIAHRDIKDENIVIDKDLQVKLIDFGSATIVDPREIRPYYTLFYGTAAYASSEILRKKAYQAAPAEVWTLGVLLSYLLTGVSPFPSVKEAIEGKIVLPESPKIPRSAMSLMRRCLDPNPKTRATIAEVKKHSWLASSR